MASKQTTKRCHWVPKSYLRAFAADAERRKIWRFSKNAGEAELKPVEKVAVQFHLYVPMDGNGRRDDSFEQKLADLEQWFGGAPWRALCEGYVDLSQDWLRKMVSLLAATMFLRNPSQFARVRDIHAWTVELCSGPKGLPDSIEIDGQRVTFDPAGWPAYRDASEDDLKRMWIAEIKNATHYAKLFMGMRWSMLVAEEPVFITTDNPVTFVHPSLKFRGIKDPETMTIFPISPTRVLSFDHLHKEPANQYYRLNGSAASQNVSMWRGSIEHMFSHRHPDIVSTELLEDAERAGFA